MKAVNHKRIYRRQLRAGSPGGFHSFTAGAFFQAGLCKAGSLAESVTARRAFLFILIRWLISGKETLVTNCKPDFLNSQELRGFDQYREGIGKEIIISSHKEKWLQRGLAGCGIDVYLEDKAISKREADDLFELITAGRTVESNQVGIPWEYYIPDGLIGGITRYTIENANRPQPPLALAVAIAIVGTVLARRVVSDRGDTPNHYTIGIAPSGGGKNFPLQVYKSLIEEAGGGHIVGPNTITSAAAALTAAKTYLEVGFPIDEIGCILSTINSKTASSHQQEISAFLLNAWTSLSEPRFKWKGYAKAEDNFEQHRPAYSLLGMANPATLFGENAIDKKSVADGFLGRVLPFETSTVPPQRSVVRRDFPEAVRQALSNWIEFQPESGNVPSSVTLHRKVIPVSPEANQAFKAFGVRRDVVADHYNEKDGAAILRRDNEKAGKLALIYACSEHTPAEDFRIEKRHAEWGIRLVGHLTDHLLERIKTTIISSDREKRLDEIADFIRKKGRQGATLTDIYYGFRGLKTADRKELLSELAEAGEIKSKTIGTTGRPTTRLIHCSLRDQAGSTGK
ncbi:YfjI family protein [bacterium]|nr:YfjI family protein [bacterium]